MQLHSSVFQQKSENMLAQMVLGKLDIHKWKDGTVSLTLVRINSKWNKALNMKPRSLKLLGGNRSSPRSRQKHWTFSIEIQ